MAPALKRSWLLLAIGILVVSLISLALILTGGNNVAHPPLAAKALQSILKSPPPSPITNDLLELNGKRRIAGLAEVNARWSIASIGIRVADGPQIRVLLNDQGQPAKVILGPQRGWGGPPVIQEYEVTNGKLNGLAATWCGSAMLLNTVENYQNNTLEGLTRYYSKDGLVITSCVFHKGQPWTGRMLRRNGFDSTSWDVSYHNGKLDGEEIYYEQGRPERLRTFKDGVQHGPERRYYNGRLSSETVWENGTMRDQRSWHANGQLQAEAIQDANDQSKKSHRLWNEDGTLHTEEFFKNDKYHGRRREQGHPDNWFWNGQSLGGGDHGRKQFEARETK